MRWLRRYGKTWVVSMLVFLLTFDVALAGRRCRPQRCCQPCYDVCAPQPTCYPIETIYLSDCSGVYVTEPMCQPDGAGVTEPATPAPSAPVEKEPAPHKTEKPAPAAEDDAAPEPPEVEPTEPQAIESPTPEPPATTPAPEPPATEPVATEPPESETTPAAVETTEAPAAEAPLRLPAEPEPAPEPPPITAEQPDAPIDALFDDPPEEKAPAEKPAEPKEEPFKGLGAAPGESIPAAEDAADAVKLDDLFEPPEEKPAEPAPADESKESPADDDAADASELDDLFAPPEEKPAEEAPADEAETPQPLAPAEEPAEEPAEQPAEKPAEEESDDDLEDLFGDPDTTALRTTVPGGLGSEELRTWVDDTGLYSVQARLIKVMGSKVRLLKDNGRTTTLPMSRLSQADQKFVANQLGNQDTRLATHGQP